MKKFIAKLALALLPAALYLAVFVAFEPNNYFGLRGVTSGNAPIARLRAYQLDPQPNLLLGDSRMAHFDMALVDEVSGASLSLIHSSRQAGQGAAQFFDPVHRALTSSGIGAKRMLCPSPWMR